MLMSPMGLRPENSCAGDAQQNLKTTDPISRQKCTPHHQICNCIKIIKEEKSWLRVPDGCPTPRQTGRLTESRNMTFTLKEYPGRITYDVSTFVPHKLIC
jgi:hypothetical protein